MSGQQTVSTATQLVLAFVAVIGLSGAAVHYVAAQTGRVELQAAKLESVSAQIPFIWNAVQLQGERLATVEDELAAVKASVAQNASLLEEAKKRDEEMLDLLKAIRRQRGGGETQ